MDGWMNEWSREKTNDIFLKFYFCCCCWQTSKNDKIGVFESHIGRSFGEDDTCQNMILKKKIKKAIWCVWVPERVNNVPFCWIPFSCKTQPPSPTASKPCVCLCNGYMVYTPSQTCLLVPPTSMFPSASFSLLNAFFLLLSSNIIMCPTHSTS